MPYGGPQPAWPPGPSEQTATLFLLLASQGAFAIGAGTGRVLEGARGTWGIPASLSEISKADALTRRQMAITWTAFAAATSARCRVDNATCR